MKTNFVTSTITTQPVEHVESTVPGFVKTDYRQFVEFLDHYFQYLNKDLNKPSKTLTELLTSREIDKLAEEFLEMIAYEIAKGWPESAKMDRRTLLKRIVELNKIKGNFSSFDAFFQIFFREKACYYEPSQDLFTLSSDRHRYDWQRDLEISDYEYQTQDYDFDLTEEFGQRYRERWIEGINLPIGSRDGHISSTKRLHDGIFFQRFSYSVFIEKRFSEWRDTFLQMLHPAGARLFAQTLLVSKLTPKYVAEHMNAFVDRLNKDLIFILERALIQYLVESDEKRNYWELYSGHILYSYDWYKASFYNSNIDPYDPYAFNFEESWLNFGNYPIYGSEFQISQDFQFSSFLEPGTTFDDFEHGSFMFSGFNTSNNYNSAQLLKPSEWFLSGFVNPYDLKIFNLPKIYHNPTFIWRLDIESSGSTDLIFNNDESNPDFAEYAIENQHTHLITGWFNETFITKDVLLALSGTKVTLYRANEDIETITVFNNNIENNLNGINRYVSTVTDQYNLFDVIFKYGTAENFNNNYDSEIILFTEDFYLSSVKLTNTPNEYFSIFTYLYFPFRYSFLLNFGQNAGNGTEFNDPYGGSIDFEDGKVFLYNIPTSDPQPILADEFFNDYKLSYIIEAVADGIIIPGEIECIQPKHYT